MIMETFGVDVTGKVMVAGRDSLASWEVASWQLSGLGRHVRLDLDELGIEVVDLLGDEAIHGGPGRVLGLSPSFITVYESLVFLLQFAV